MAELSEKGRKLIEVAMAHDEPPSTEQSWGALVSRLTGEAPHEPMAAPAAGPTSRRTLWIVIAISCVVAIAVLRLTMRDPEAVGPAASEGSPPPVPTSSHAPDTAKAPPEPTPDELLAGAEAALAAGDADRAMVLLQRHAVDAATDDTAPRRMALRVLVLCAQGERAGARAEATAFLAIHHASPWAERVRHSCVGDERE